jgi:hypothetical protein
LFGKLQSGCGFETLPRHCRRGSLASGREQNWLGIALVGCLKFRRGLKFVSLYITVIATVISFLIGESQT